MQLIHFELVDLLGLCIVTPENQEAWAELCRRVLPRIRYFVRGTLQRMIGPAFASHRSVLASGVDETDLCQEIFVGLVENDYALLKRFFGSSEAEFLAYIAGISRRVVRDCARRQLASKRIPGSRLGYRSVECTCIGDRYSTPIEERIFCRELLELVLYAVQDTPRRAADRNRVIAQLYFFDGLSAMQIAQIEGIALSQAGVKRVLSRIRERIRILRSFGSVLCRS